MRTKIGFFMALTAAILSLVTSAEKKEIIKIIISGTTIINKSNKAQSIKNDETD